jgi:tRNA-specific 2-thiouridylase
MPKTIAIALSGGIDSLVSAALLKEQGHQLIGIHFLTGYESIPTNRFSSSFSKDALIDLIGLAQERLNPMVDQLDIPLYVIDLRTEFKSRVVDYFIRTYQEGRTPNPCLQCNPSIKFTLLLKKAKRYGAAHIATGHYAQICTGSNGRMHLIRGVDPGKDQSYFLARLTQGQLKSAVLPLGRYTKDQTRQMAKEMGLRPASNQESQDICFIKNGTYGEFLATQPGFSAKPGPIVDLDGNELGQHHGLHLFTIGQRRGINCPAAEPYYVIRIEPSQNRLVVGRKNDLSVRSFVVNQINWIAPPPLESIDISVRVRYRHQAVPATLLPLDADRAEIVFKTPQNAVTPGQGAVFYDHDEVLGGGWIQ